MPSLRGPTRWRLTPGATSAAWLTVFASSERRSLASTVGQSGRDGLRGDRDIDAAKIKNAGALGIVGAPRARWIRSARTRESSIVRSCGRALSAAAASMVRPRSVSHPETCTSSSWSAVAVCVERRPDRRRVRSARDPRGRRVAAPSPGADRCQSWHCAGGTRLREATASNRVARTFDECTVSPGMHVVRGGLHHIH